MTYNEARRFQRFLRDYLLEKTDVKITIEKVKKNDWQVITR